MAIEQAQIQNALVFRDSDYPHRWYDAIGPGVAKYLQEFVALAADDTTTDPDEWVDTVVEVGTGVSTAVLGDVAGGALVITTAANDNDGWSMQLGNANSGEFVALTSGNHCYFGVEFNCNDADNTDCLFGLSVTDTAIIAAVTDGIYFRSIDAVDEMYFVTERDSIESLTSVCTLSDTAYTTAEFLFDGSVVTAYINGVEVASVSNSSDTFPDDELLRLAVEFLTGETTANVCTIKWLRVIHLTG